MAVVVSGYYETVRSTMSYNCFVAPYMKLARNYFSNESSHIFTYTSKTYIHTIFLFHFRSLYHTFGSPFSDTTCKPHEIGKSKVISKRLDEN